MAKGQDGWLAVFPETAGWKGTTVFQRGNFIYGDSESLGINKEIKTRDNKITFGRAKKASSRQYGKQVPGGDITWQFRSDDLPMIMMAHFQKYIGTAIGSSGSVAGSCIYTFVPEKGVPNYGGSAFGTGSYTSPNGDMYTVGVKKKLFNTTQNGGTNAQVFTSGIVDELMITMAGDDDAKVKAMFKFANIDYGTGIPSSVDPNGALGSYSAKPSFEHWSATMTVGGTQMEINKMEFTSKNALEDMITLGNLNPSRYKFGKYDISGSLDLDMPRDGMRYFGSMTQGVSFALVATFFNGTCDWVSFNLPDCRWKSFEVGMKGGAAEDSFTLPFEAFESQDGLTAPIIVTVNTESWGSTPAIRV